MPALQPALLLAALLQAALGPVHRGILQASEAHICVCETCRHDRAVIALTVPHVSCRESVAGELGAVMSTDQEKHHMLDILQRLHEQQLEGVTRAAERLALAKELHKQVGAGARCGRPPGSAPRSRVCVGCSA